MSEALEALIELQTRVQTIGRGYEYADSAARCNELFATIRAALEQPSTAEPVAWLNVERDGLPALGTRVIVCIDGVVQSEAFELDQGDDGNGGGEYFWGRDDLDECPAVKPTDRWMPWPTFYAAPPSTAEIRARALDADELAQHIRKIDGDHSMGAGALAESICEFLAKRIREGG